MLVDLNLRGKFIIVIGGGKEATKRIKALISQNAEILVISEKIDKEISRLVKDKIVKFKKQKIRDIEFLKNRIPDILITTTDDYILNQKLITFAKKKKVLVYSSDNPDSSDFANPSIIDFDGIIKVAIFTGGKSPVMSKKIRIKVEKALKNTITRQDLIETKIQQFARISCRKKILTSFERTSFLKSVSRDNKIKQLIKVGDSKKAEKRIMELLDDWR